MIHNVIIFSNRSAAEATQDINQALAQYQDEDTQVAYELLIESSASVAGISDTRYTVLIEVADRDEP